MQRDDAMKYVGAAAAWRDKRAKASDNGPLLLPVRSPLTDGATPLYN